MSACQICGEPMLFRVTANGTIAECSKYVVHPATFFGIERLARLRQWRAEHQNGAPLNGVTR